MIVIIIAGGSGTRLWPLSTPTKPKQFLTIDESGRSLLQKTYDRVKGVADKVYVVPSAPIYDETVRQLPEIRDNIICEPSRRGVGNALYVALRYLRRDGVSDTEPVFVLWSDHLIHDEKTFARMVENARKAVESGAQLVQFGIVPTYSSNQLGYIKKGTSSSFGADVFEIELWKYQPDQETANAWFESGDWLWNAGYFVSTPRYILGEVERESPESYASFKAIDAASDSELAQVYDAQEVAVLDNVFSEKMKGAHVVACTFDWIDVGNFNDLHSVSSLDDSGNYLKGNSHIMDVHDGYVRNELDVPVAVIGLDNIVVVATKDGILVANKSQARKVGDIAKQIAADQV
jgi:mannose-1-phosphate guanylyltransferase